MKTKTAHSTQFDLSKIRMVVCDVDGVLMPYDSVVDEDGNPVFNQICSKAKTKAIQRYIPDLSEEDAIRLGQESYTQHNDAMSAFKDVAEEAGYDWAELQITLLRDYHEILFNDLYGHHPEYFAPNPELIEAVEKVHEYGCQNVLASHACRIHWLAEAFNKNGLGHLYPHENRMGREDFFDPGEEPNKEGRFKKFLKRAFNKAVHPLHAPNDEIDPKRKLRLKHECGKFLQRISDKRDVPLQQMAFLEDTSRNLTKAKQDCPDVLTVYIHGGKPLDKDHQDFAYVDMQFRTAADFYQNLGDDLEATHIQSKNNRWKTLFSTMKNNNDQDTLSIAV